jgi:hypothetical protein
MPQDPVGIQSDAAALVRLSDELTTSLRAVIRSSAIDGLGPIEMARALNIDKTLASRLLTALRADSPLTALSSLPGTAPLREFVRAARDHSANPRAAEDAERVLRAFDLELQRTFGTRTRLDAALADALPETRRRHQEGARQAVYRGMALIKGISIDLTSINWLVHPSRDNPDTVDILVLVGYVGIRRLRPSARVRLSGRHSRAKPESGAQLIPEFCRPSSLAMSATTQGQFTYYELSSGSIRRDAASDVFLTEFLRSAAPTLNPQSAGRPLAMGNLVSHPCKRLSLNVMVHDDAWPDIDFSLRAYDTAGIGSVRPPDPASAAERLDISASVTRTRASVEALRSFPVPRYHEVIEHSASPLGWDLARFRMFTAEIVYPLYGADLLLVQE